VEHEGLACNLFRRLALENMKTQNSLQANSIRRLLLLIPVLCSIPFAACSDVAGTAGTHPSVNLQIATLGESQTGENVTIGPEAYNSEDRSFDSPWPFGPETNPQ
jgi:hypothetical protein